MGVSVARGRREHFQDLSFEGAALGLSEARGQRKNPQLVIR